MTSSNAAASAKPWRFRARSSLVYAALTAVLLLGWAWAAASVGTGSLLRALPWVASCAVVAWMVFLRPQIEVTQDGVTLVNPVRTVRVPWAALVHVTTQYALTLHTPHAKYSAWAAPGPGRHVAGMSSAMDVRAVQRTAGAAPGLGDLPNAPSGVAAHEIRERWQELVEAGAIEAGIAEETPVAVTVAWGLLAVVAGLLALAGATALLA